MKEIQGKMYESIQKVMDYEAFKSTLDPLIFPGITTGVGGRGGGLKMAGDIQ
jgi:hypothetical protein